MFVRSRCGPAACGPCLGFGPCGVRGGGCSNLGRNDRAAVADEPRRGPRAWNARHWGLPLGFPPRSATTTAAMEALPPYRRVTLIERLFGALRLDRSLYEEASLNPDSLGQAVMVVLLGGALNG